MPKKKQVSTLVDLAICSIGEFVTTEAELIWTTFQTNQEHGHTKLDSMLEFIKHLLNLCIPQHLSAKISIAVLTAVANLFKNKRFTIFNYKYAKHFILERAVALPLIEVAVGAHLRAFEFGVWPSIMQDVLYNKLYDMVGLESLNLDSLSSIKLTLSDFEEMVARGVSAMPNLVCFILHFRCTDNIISALAKNCKKLQELDVYNSKLVTESSVGPLLSCKHLRHVKLHMTSMTVPGYANLLLEHLKIEDIGRCNKFGDVLKHTYQEDVDDRSSFHIRTLETRNISMEHLYLLIDLCPYITRLCLEYCEDIDDLSILATLDYLKELKLAYCDFYTHGIKTLLEIKGCAIRSLHLQYVRRIDFDALISISQYCPDIRDLVFDSCKLFEYGVHSLNLAIRPFQFLERIICTTEFPIMHLEFLLSHCINIKFIQLYHAAILGDSTMRSILLQNPMSKLEKLKILDSHSLSMKTVQLLMQNCDNLRHLSELEAWRGISRYELNILREDLKATNTNLDTTPTTYVGKKIMFKRIKRNNLKG
ncbi:uncharacterized protein LOC128881887 [Hylaeus volcanicus]|uniref:uncharacterized protein LOC128881887 n=1 Tax=Hylaeus volcanicus TaxID=313075 RepID=UPI0023B79559|nr:uncharacterized protein LOC128881887 [Hylaeus volcanicus]XP_053989257.1 uncharacterized protein LOC128881887 [Hylaeus volcanicus]XP_053989258.1 uncharacterized protein LOC128881887 [Hylaeus volcanicus]